MVGSKPAMPTDARLNRIAGFELCRLRVKAGCCAIGVARLRSLKSAYV